MTYFTKTEFENKYNLEVQEYQIENACEMIYSQIGLAFREVWSENNVPEPIKKASMEQLRFMLEYEIPEIDFKGRLEAGAMTSELKTDYSTLALRILANNGYLYRGNPINSGLSMNIPFGE
jgi:hypothetical protein